MLLQLPPSETDRNIVFITSALQPDVGVQDSLEVTVQDTCNRLLGHITENFKKASRRGGLTLSYSYLVGPDELEWTDDKPRLLAPRSQQREKISSHECDVISRCGWNATAIRNWRALKTETQVHRFTATAGTPNSSSRKLIADIAEFGTTNAVEQAALRYVLQDYTQEAIERRNSLPPVERVLSIGEINRMIVRGAETDLGIVF